MLGGFLFVVLLTVGVWLFVRWLKSGEEKETEEKVEKQKAQSHQPVAVL